jgi:uncharacterized protein
MDRRKWLVGIGFFLVAIAAILIWQRCAVENFLVALGSPRLATVATKLGLDFGAPCNGTYPLIKAVRAGDEPAVHLLLQIKVNLNVRDELGGTPLIWAAEKDEPEIAAELIAAGAELNTVDNQGATALRHAVRTARLELVEQLIKAGANVNIADEYGETPLLQAVASGKLEMAQLLLAHGADISAKTKKGYTAADYLPANHDPELAKQFRTVYFVPIGQSPTTEINEMVGYYRDKFGIEIKVLPTVQPEQDDVDPSRRQLIAENLIATMLRAHPEYAGNSSVILIGITAQDIYPREFGWRFTFGWRDGQQHAAVASTARMGLHYYGEPQDEATVLKRLRKVITKDIGILVLDKRANDNPKSVLYNGIGGIEELDAVSDDF